MGLLSVKVTDHATGAIVFAKRFERFPVRIGRNAENEVHLDYPFIPRWFAEIRQMGARLTLHALTDHNPLRFPDQSILRLGTPTPLEGKLLATAATLELCLEPDLPAPPAPISPTDEPPAIRVPPVEPREGPSLRQPGPGLTLDLSSAHNTEQRRARLLAEVAALKKAYQPFEQARRAWQDACVAALKKLSSASDKEPGDVRVVFREFSPADRPPEALDSDELVGPGELSAVAHAATELLPGLQAPSGESEIRRFLIRVVDILRVFAGCGLELQRCRSRQSTELGVTWEVVPDPLAALETREDLLRYLLDWREPGEARSEELVRSFAGIVDHLQCYVQAALASTRAVVFSLSPQEMERSVTHAWPLRSAALWRHFETTFNALCGDTYDHLTPAFRAALTQAYVQALQRAGIPFRQHEPAGAP